MSLFNLKDIRYVRDEFRKFRNVSDNFSTNVLKYPIDIGSTDKGHYMLIHINTQEKSSYAANLDPENLPSILKSKSRVNVGGNLGNIFQAAGSFAGGTVADLRKNVEYAEYDADTWGTKVDTQTAAGRTLLNIVAKAESLGSNISKSPLVRDVLQGVGSSFTEKPLSNANFLRTVKRTKDSIALYMPDTLAFSHDQQYSGLEMGGEPIAAGAALGSIVSDYAQGRVDRQQTITNLSPFIGLAAKNALENFGRNSVQAIFASVFGVVQNPMMELIYTRPNFRSFRFDFVFNPRSERESSEVHQIIKRLYFHQAPEIAEGTAGYFLVPPSEFDIEFYYNGIQNPNIPKISTCVLTNIQVDYAPNGFTAYEIPGENAPTAGRTGSPVSIRLTLSFTETEIVTKADYSRETEQGEGSARGQGVVGGI
jgi:hypothetical protein